ncbi:LysR family transcriptional regulator [Paenarthrobacter sp. NPDC057981]|uniref:LysR family transcriptional regulator n=1 Tax=Paenarthrobacter sp. NPDC057981 TaxID=3346297 RepID=UPI0036D97689
MSIELAWLRTWLGVVDVGGFARAAEHLHLSQPRVSAHVANLERTLGHVLIERRVRPLTLTDAGYSLLPKARAAVAAADELVTWNPNNDVLSGLVKVGSVASVSSEFLPNILSEFASRYEEVELRVLDGDVELLESALVERRVAVALRPLRPEPKDPQVLEVRPLWRERFVVVLPDGHPLLATKVVRVKDLAAFRVLTVGNPLSDSLLGYETATYLKAQAPDVAVGAVLHQPTTLAAMVRAGLGVGIVNLLAARMIKRPGLVIRSIDRQDLYRDVGIWWHAERPLSRADQVFIRTVLDAQRPRGTSLVPRR